VRLAFGDAAAAAGSSTAVSGSLVLLPQDAVAGPLAQDTLKLQLLKDMGECGLLLWGHGSAVRSSLFPLVQLLETLGAYRQTIVTIIAAAPHGWPLMHPCAFRAPLHLHVASPHLNMRSAATVCCTNSCLNAVCCCCCCRSCYSARAAVALQLRLRTTAAA
jgi:hypothetical protein